MMHHCSHYGSHSKKQTCLHNWNNNESQWEIGTMLSPFKIIYNNYSSWCPTQMSQIGGQSIKTAESGSGSTPSFHLSCLGCPHWEVVGQREARLLLQKLEETFRGHPSHLPSPGSTSTNSCSLSGQTSPVTAVSPHTYLKNSPNLS